MRITLHTLINQLLDLSKIESGQMKLEVVKGDIIACRNFVTASIL
ncbi:MAG: hypothetical protein R3B93_07655 [Bacteroidia bacterium]